MNGYLKTDYNAERVDYLNARLAEARERLGDKWILATPKQRIVAHKSVLDAYDEVSQADYFDAYGRPVPF